MMTPEMIEFLQMPMVQTVLGWVLAVLIAVWVAIRVVNSGRLLAFNNPTGRVLVSRGAIKGLIAKTCNMVEGVSHPQSRLCIRGGRLRVRLYIQLRGNARLSDVASLLQEKLDMALRQNLGIERIGKIDVIVTDIHPVMKKSSASSRGSSGVGAYPWEERYGE